MEWAFYFFSLVAVVTTVRVITHTKAVYALLYLIVSLLAIACVFFSLGADFAGAMEVIVYAGAIMVLFVFVVMMLDMGIGCIQQERIWLNPRVWIWPSIMSLAMLAVLTYALVNTTINEHDINDNCGVLKAVSITLFGPYVLAVELASMLLLAGLLVAFHFGQHK